MRSRPPQRIQAKTSLQLNLASDEKIGLDPIVEEQLVQWMAEMLLAAVIARQREAGDDAQSS